MLSFPLPTRLKLSCAQDYDPLTSPHMHPHISQHTFSPSHSHSPTHAPSHLTEYILTLSQPHTCTLTPHQVLYIQPPSHTHTQNKAPPHVEGELLKQNTKAYVGKKGWKKYFFIVSQSFFIKVAMTTSCYDNVKILLPLENDTPQFSVRSTLPSIHFFCDLK